MDLITARHKLLMTEFDILPMIGGGFRDVYNSSQIENGIIEIWANSSQSWAGGVILTDRKKQYKDIVDKTFILQIDVVEVTSNISGSGYGLLADFDVTQQQSPSEGTDRTAWWNRDSSNNLFLANTLGSHRYVKKINYANASNVKEQSQNAYFGILLLINSIKNERIKIKIPRVYLA